MTDLQRAKSLLVEDKTCVLVKGEKVYTSNAAALPTILSAAEKPLRLSPCAMNSIIGAMLEFLRLAVGAISTAYAFPL